MGLGNRLWLLPLLVAICMGAAVLAYLHATQLSSRSAQTHADGAWNRISPAQFHKLFARAKVSYDRDLYVARARATSRTTAVRFLQKHSTVAESQPRSVAARTRIKELTTWGRYLPTTTRYTISSSTLSGRIASVRVGIVLVVPDSVHVTRELTAAATLVLRRGAKGHWRIIDVRSSRIGIRAIHQPTLVHKANVGVLTAHAHVKFAQHALTEALAAIPEVHQRYPGVSEALREFILIADSERIADSMDLGDNDIGKPGGYTLESGEIVLLWPRMGSIPLGQQLALVRHESVHVITAPLSARAPTLLIEGLATYEEARILAKYDYFYIFTPFSKALANGSLNYSNLFHSTDPTFNFTSEKDIDLGYLAAYATIAYVDKNIGHRRLLNWLTLVRKGISIDKATVDVLKRTPAQLELAVRGWASSHPHGIFPN